jgi:hypothetical protein
MTWLTVGSQWLPSCDVFGKSVAGFEALRRFSPKRRRVAIQCNFLRNFESFLIWFGHPQRSWNTHSWHFEILILNLSSSRFFLATILKCFNLKSSHCFLRVRHNEFVYIIFYIYHPPLIIIPIGQPLLQLFIREHFQIFGLRWCCSDDFVDLSFVWTLWTHTILHIFPWLPPSSTFWQWHSGHEYDVAASTILFFCLQSSCRHIFRSSKIFFGDISYHFGESQLCASFLWQGIQPST